MYTKLHRIILAAVLLLLLPLPPAACAAAPYQDGIYQDLAPGYSGEVIITVTVRDGRIVSLDAKNRNGGESEYFLKAREGLEQALIAAQSPEGLEAVTGATGTSTSILEALRLILVQLVYTGKAAALP
jgi:uncharacterized protein with FMN-binding domain